MKGDTICPCGGLTPGDAFACGGCGHHRDGTGQLTTARCGKCPPALCGDCGKWDQVDGPMCDCWRPIAGMPLADIKAMFADVGLGVAGDGRLTS